MPILESFMFRDRLVSLCIYRGKPTVIIQGEELRYQSFDDILDAISVFDMIIQYWLEEEKFESALFLQHPEVTA